MGHMVLPLTHFNCQNLHKFIYKLSEHVTMCQSGTFDLTRQVYKHRGTCTSLVLGLITV